MSSLLFYRVEPILSAFWNAHVVIEYAVILYTLAWPTIIPCMEEWKRKFFGEVQKDEEMFGYVFSVWEREQEFMTSSVQIPHICGGHAWLIKVSLRANHEKLNRNFRGNCNKEQHENAPIL